MGKHFFAIPLSRWSELVFIKTDKYTHTQSYRPNTIVILYTFALSRVGLSIDGMIFQQVYLIYSVDLGNCIWGR